MRHNGGWNGGMVVVYNAVFFATVEE